MAKQNFREDLFYRLNAIHVVLSEEDTFEIF
jgi:transcriptional regulator with PAS, ATPase and Fis domain